MNPIYFPFTYMPDPVADVLATWFDRITVLSPSKKEIDTNMHDLASRGWLSIQAPFDGDDAVLDEVIKSYRAWVDLHGGAQLKQFMAQKWRTPFHDDSSVYQLLDEIRSRSLNPSATKKKSEQTSRHREADIQKSRILLLIVQEFDRRNWEIQQDLATVASIERDFWKQLHATDDAANSYPLHPVLWPDGGYPSYMLMERLTAWSCFLLQKNVSSRIFVTTSESIVERLIQVLPMAELLIEIKEMAINGISINRMPGQESVNTITAKWRKKLAQWLADQVMCVETTESNAFPIPPVPQKGEQTTSLRIYRTDYTPLQWFRLATGIDDPFEPKQIDRSDRQATLLAFVSKDGC